MDTSVPFHTLHRFITSGGTIDVGRLDYIECAAVASDAQTLWVALNRRDGEMLHDLLKRLDETLRLCLERKVQVNETSVAV